MRDLAEARCALADVGRALSQARREMSRLRLDVLGADIQLSWILTSPHEAGPGVEPGERGEPVRDVVTSCDDARKAGERVDRQLRRAVAGIKAAVVIVDGLHPVDTQDELDQVRLERRLTTLQSDLEATRTVLAGTTQSLGVVADRARQARPVTGHARGHLPAERLSGAVRTAQEQTRYAEEELTRAQVRTDRIGAQVGTLDQGARVRVHARRDHSPGPPAPSAGIPR